MLLNAIFLLVWPLQCLSATVYDGGNVAEEEGLDPFSSWCSTEAYYGNISYLGNNTFHFSWYWETTCVSRAPADASKILLVRNSTVREIFKVTAKQNFTTYKYSASNDIRAITVNVYNNDGDFFLYDSKEANWKYVSGQYDNEKWFYRYYRYNFIIGTTIVVVAFSSTIFAYLMLFLTRPYKNNRHTALINFLVPNIAACHLLGTCVTFITKFFFWDYLIEYHDVKSHYISSQGLLISVSTYSILALSVEYHIGTIKCTWKCVLILVLTWMPCYFLKLKHYYMGPYTPQIYVFKVLFFGVILPIALTIVCLTVPTMETEIGYQSLELTELNKKQTHRPTAEESNRPAEDSNLNHNQLYEVHLESADVGSLFRPDLSRTASEADEASNERVSSSEDRTVAIRRHCIAFYIGHFPILFWFVYFVLVYS